MHRISASSRGNFVIRLVSLLAITVALGVAGAMSASAEARPVTFDEQGSTSIRYGQQWQVTATSDSRFAYGEPSVELTGPVSMTAPGRFYPMADGLTSKLYLPLSEAELLDAGTYELSVTIRMGYFGESLVSSSATPAVITVEPAPVASDLQIVSDPNNPSNAIISLRMTGKYIDEAMYKYLGYPEIPANYPETPGGTWFVAIKDADGATVFETSIVQDTGGGPFTSIYWTGFAPDTIFTGEARFETTSESAQNFDIAPIAPFSYTSLEQRPDPVVEADTEADALGAISSGFRPAMWMLWGSGVVAIGLIITMVFLIVQMRKKPRMAGTDFSGEIGEIES